MVDTRRATSVALGDRTVATIEHLTAALAGLSIRSGLSIELEAGDEIPILDGCALAFAEALASLSLPASPPTLRVARRADLTLGMSRMRFTPGESVHVRAEVSFGDPRLEESAEWCGDAASFVAEIAPARTFAFAGEVQSFVDAGLARHVARESVVVVTDDAILHAGRPFAASEPVRHKLLDLLGDLYLYGGPPIGSICAYRPGHASTHALVARAIADGTLEACEGVTTD